MKKTILLTIVLFTFLSCADRYSTRTRTHSHRIDTYHKSKEVIIKTKKPGETYDNNSPQEIIEVLEDKPISDISDEVVSTDVKASAVLQTAYSYLGTPYRYGGNTRSGIDCSGLVGNAFKEIDISLARSASDMSEQGTPISLNDVEKGDLLFFATGKGGRIRHVGIVVEKDDNIKFIHASTSRGVIVSSMDDKYWSRTFRKAKRVL